MGKSKITRSAKIILDDEGILTFILHDKCEYTIDDAKENVGIAKKFCNGKPAPLCVDMAGMLSVDKASREYGTSDELANQFTAMAMLARSKVGVIIGNMFIGFNKPPIPTKLFTDKKKAMDWLRKHLRK